MKNFLISIFVIGFSIINTYSSCVLSGGFVSGLNTICQNEITFLTVSGVSGDFFVWEESHNGAGWIPTLANQTTLSFSAFVAGTHKFRVKSRCFTGQETFSNELTVIVNPPAAAATSDPLFANLRNATARFTVSGNTYTGFLINHTSNDGRLLFLTTNQPQVCSTPNWNNVVFTWQSDGMPITSIGATFLASENKMTLLELNNPPNIPMLTYLGWDLFSITSPIACIFESGTFQSMSKSIITTNYSSLFSVNLDVFCNGNFSESFGPSFEKISSLSQGSIVKSGRGAPLISGDRKVIGMYVAGEEENCADGPFYFAKLFSSPNIVSYLRDNSETNAATVSMNFCKSSEDDLNGNFDKSNTFSVSEHIISSQNIIDGNVVRYEAGTYIELNSGFVSGTNFVAEINPCVRNVTIIAAKNNKQSTEEKVNIFNFISTKEDNWIKIYTSFLLFNQAITIEAKESINGLNLQIYNTQGTLVRSFKLHSFGKNNSISVPLTEIPSGMYIIKAQDTTRLFTQKILIK